MAGMKVFRLRLKSDMLKVQKCATTQTSADLSKREAKIIRFSPDTKWLATIGAGNSIRLYRRSELENDKSPTLFLQKSVELKRLHRDTSNRNAKDGSLGDYNRSINRLTFSADSRILAVSDISGFLDTWVLEGQEDLEQINDPDSNPADIADKSDSSDEEDFAEAESRTILFGEHWIRNPAASLLTKLPAAPLVLTFRPSTTQATRTLTNGNVGVHPTRHNPHPHSHDLPNGEDRLFVLTAENQMYELNVLSGKISDWSRRNPTSSLPQGFRDLRDRAKGAVWDLRWPNERIWLYGVSWLWMFDLSQELSPVDDWQRDVHATNNLSKEVSLKRKRGDNDGESTASRPRTDTGAGSKISNAELGIGIGRTMRTIDGPDGVVSQLIDMDMEPEFLSDDEGGHVLANESNLTLMKLRRGTTETNGHMPTRHIDNSTGAETSEDDGTRVAMTGRGRRPAHWHTYKYRPILGIVPVGGEADDESAEGLEVALVERPMLEVDLPPRYFGDQEWDP